jgi:hypothetical protein
VTAAAATAARPVNFLAASRENKSVVAVQHSAYRGPCVTAPTGRRPAFFPKGGAVVRNNLLHTEFPTLEARIRAAGAERSVEVGYAIGDSLAKLGFWMESFLAPKREPLRVQSHHFAAHH